jgi:magnesium chelatase family protein
MATGVVGAIALTGLQAQAVRVEAVTAGGLPATRIVGLPDASVREAADRVEAAYRRCGLSLPQTKRVVNLSPGGLRKVGSGFDLPVALALLVPSGHLPPRALAGVVAAGELGLDGSVRPTPGTLPIVAAARDHGAERVVVSAAVAPEAALVDGIKVIGVATLQEALDILAGRDVPRPCFAPPVNDCSIVPDLADVRGQQLARRALEVAASGGHHMLMIGPPGCGKSMLARRLPGLLPPLSTDEALEVAAIRSVAGLRAGDEPLDLTPPFRDPHHTTSIAGLVGGGAGIARPGELSLAHRGCLFMDELLETPRWVLDALRQPLETGRVVLVRSQGTVSYPASVQLVAATNPCPCGGINGSGCRCRPDQVERYRSRLSGPLLDRVDVQVELVPVGHDVMVGDPDGEPTAAVAARVAVARAAAANRQGTVLNRDAPITLVRATASATTLRRLANAIAGLGLSARAFDRCLRVARTVADLAGHDLVTADDVDEAVAYRLVQDMGAAA